MRRKLIVLGGIALLAVFASAGSYAATPKEAPDVVKIDDCVTKKAAVEFPHGVHSKAMACTTCHHTQEGLTATATMEVQTCGSCHVAPEKAETPKCAEMSLTKNPFHISCVNCHKDEIKKDATKVLPTKCDDCHPKT